MDARGLDITFPIPSRDGFMQAEEFLIGKADRNKNVYVSVFQYVHECTSQTIQSIRTAVLSEYQRLYKLITYLQNPPNSLLNLLVVCMKMAPKA